MPITLRFNPERQQQASAAAFGVGMPITDGGASAVAGGLQRVASAAGQIGARLERKDQANKSAAGGIAYQSYQTEVIEAKNAALLALEKDEQETYEEAVAKLQALDPNQGNFGFAVPESSKGVKMSDEDWAPYISDAKKYYATEDGQFQRQVVHAQHKMNISGFRDGIRRTYVDAVASDPTLRNSDTYEDFLVAAHHFTTGENVQAATPEVQAFAQKEMAQDARSMVSAYALDYDAITDVKTYNETLDRMATVTRRSGSFGEHKVDVLKAIESAKVDVKNKVGLTFAAENSIGNFSTQVGASSEVSATDIAEMTTLVANYQELYPSLPESDQRKVVSTAQMAGALLRLEGAERTKIRQWHQQNPDADGRKFFVDNPDFVDSKLAMPEHLNSLGRYVENVIQAGLPTFPEQSPGSATPFGFSLRTHLSDLSPEYRDLFRQGDLAMTQVLNDPSLLEGKVGDTIRRGYSPIFDADKTSTQFPGLGAVVDFLSKSQDPRALTSTVSILDNVWGPDRTAMFVAAYDDSPRADDSIKRLMAALHISRTLPEGQDTRAFQKVEAGLQIDQFLLANKGTAVGDKFEEFQKRAQDPSSPIEQLLNSLGGADPVQEELYTAMIYGDAMVQIMESKSGDAANISVKDLEQRVADNWSQLFNITEHNGILYVDSVQDEPQGRFGGFDFMHQFVPQVRMLETFGLTTALSSQNVAKRLHKKGQVDKAALHVIDQGILEHNLSYLYKAYPEIREISDPAAVMRNLVNEGNFKIVQLGVVNGVPVHGFKVYLETTEMDPTFVEQLFGTEDVVDGGWFALQDGAGKPAMMPSVALNNISAQEFADQEERLDTEWWGRVLKSGARGTKSVAETHKHMAKPRVITSKKELTPFGQYIRDLLN